MVSDSRSLSANWPTPDMVDQVLSLHVLAVEPVEKCRVDTGTSRDLQSPEAQPVQRCFVFLSLPRDENCHCSRPLALPSSPTAGL